jgi:phosphoribosylglycinamide formyltransferase 1
LNNLVTNKFRLGFLASGNGSNFLNIVGACHSKNIDCEPVLLISNNSSSGAIRIAKKNNIDFFHISSKTNSNPDKEICKRMKEFNIDLIILAGYMRKIEPEILNEFENRILNIHPSLLPKYGGKGMFGENVHRAVLDSGDKFSGASVHLVDENFDEGRILGQMQVEVKAGDSVQSLASKVLKVEHQLYPKIIAEYVNELSK